LSDVVNGRCKRVVSSEERGLENDTSFECFFKSDSKRPTL
jgi:hypothetical protein